MTEQVSESQRLNNKLNPRRVLLPQNAEGVLSLYELESGTTLATVTVYFPNGLLGIKIKFVKKIAAPAATRIFAGFNNTAFDDVTIARLRRVIEADGEEAYTFDVDTVLPTKATFRVDVAEAAVGDTFAIIEAVQKR